MVQIIIQPLNCVTMSYKIVQNCLKCSLLAAGLLLFHVMQAQTGFSEVDQQLTLRQKQLGKDYALQVWKRGDTLAYQKLAGEVKQKTSVQMAASSRWLTAAMVMLLVDEGKLSLDDKITRWLPEYEKYGKNYITLRHCLTYMTGIKGDGSGVGKLFSKKKFDNLEEEVNSYAAREIQTNPGTELRYNDIGFSIAARVLEVVTKKRFDQLIKQRLFTPLKMRSTSFSNVSGGPVDPSNGAISTVEDYMKFLVMLLNKGTYHGRRVLSEESVAELLKQQGGSEPRKDLPKMVEGYAPALGSWIINSNSSSGPTVFASPGFAGPWAMIDLCRGYAYVFVVKEMKEEDNSKVQMELKAAVDAQFKEICQD
ncbi:MAG: class A beta-lactamase-related serine hydrolase [Chitinophagaceae bacterium]|nr:MAG: class A beta-lactamase-related serine hydrolase [Chitinophagaceae bacterium]